MAEISAGLRAQLSQAMAEASEWSDSLVAKFRERIQAEGEAEAMVELYASLAIAGAGDPDKILCVVLCLMARLVRMEVES